MVEDIKTRWIKALRSGEYKQGKGALRLTDGNFCCLGVLCDLHSKETGTEWSVRNGVPCYVGGETATLPYAVMLWAGLERDNPQVGDYSLADNNDGGHSFEEIATLIEKHL